MYDIYANALVSCCYVRYSIILDAINYTTVLSCYNICNGSGIFGKMKWKVA